MSHQDIAIGQVPRDHPVGIPGGGSGHIPKTGYTQKNNIITHRYNHLSVSDYRKNPSSCETSAPTIEWMRNDGELTDRGPLPNGRDYQDNHGRSPYGPCPRDALPIVIAMIGATTPSIRPHAHRGAEVPVPPRSMHPATR